MAGVQCYQISLMRLVVSMWSGFQLLGLKDVTQMQLCIATGLTHPVHLQRQSYEPAHGVLLTSATLRDGTGGFRV